MKKIVLVVLMLCVPTAAFAVPGSFGWQFATIDSVSSVDVVIDGPPTPFRIFSANVTVDPATISGQAAECETVTVYYVVDPSAISFPSTLLSIASLDEFDSVYTGFLSAVLLGKELQIVVMEGETVGSCSVLGVSLQSD